MLVHRKKDRAAFYSAISPSQKAEPTYAWPGSRVLVCCALLSLLIAGGQGACVAGLVGIVAVDLNIVEGVPAGVIDDQ